MSWVYICAITIGITTTAMFSSDFIASLLFGTADEPSVSATGLQKLVITLSVLTVCLLFNLTGTKTLARISVVGLTAELIGVVAIGLYLLIFERKQPFSVFFDTMGAEAGRVTSMPSSEHHWWACTCSTASRPAARSPRKPPIRPAPFLGRWH